MIHLAIFICMASLPIKAFDYLENSPSYLFPYNQAAIDATLPDGSSNPAYAPLIRYPYLHASGSKPYALDGLYSTLLKTGYGNGVFGAHASWSRFGFDRYLENVVEAGFGYRPVKYISLGAGVRYYNVSINTSEVRFSCNLFDGVVSVMAAPCDWLDISFQFENITSLFLKKRGDLLYPGWSAGASLKPISGLSLRWNINRTSCGYVNSISATVYILRYLSAAAGYSRESETCSAALSLIYRYVSVSYGLKYNPHLGFTHSVGVTLSAFEIPVKALNYGRMFAWISGAGGTPKIDINSCTLEELMRIPGMKKILAERIIKHRASIGPIKKEDLMRIGMDRKEAASLISLADGFGEDNPRSGKRKSGKKHEKARKRLFSQLLKEGLSASASLEISGMAIKGEHRKILDKLGSMSGIGAEKKKKILELCAGSF
jgi:hypothetical protein